MKLVIPFLRIDDDHEVIRPMYILTNCPNNTDLVTRIVDHRSVILFLTNFDSNLLANHFDSAIICRVFSTNISAFETPPFLAGVFAFQGIINALSSNNSHSHKWVI